MNNKIYSMLGLCMKAGKISYGSDMCEEKIKYGKVSLLIIAEDASENTKNKFRNLCENKTLLVEFGSIDGLSKAIGKENKAVIGILDVNFAKRINEMVIEIRGANN